MRFILAVLVFTVGACDPKPFGVELAPKAAIGGTSFACVAAAEASVRPEFGKGRRIEAVGALGLDQVAMTVEGDTLRFMSGAAVRAGTTEGTPFSVVRRDADTIIATSDTRASFDTVIIRPKEGVAVWTKARAHAVGNTDLPDGLVVYFNCN